MKTILNLSPNKTYRFTLIISPESLKELNNSCAAYPLLNLSEYFKQLINH